MSPNTSVAQASPTEGATPPAPAASAVAPAASAAKPTAARPAARWTLSTRDKTLKVALDRWAQSAGWRLFWEIGVDYRVEAPVSIDGSFEEAVSAVVRNMDQADVPPKAIFYRGNQVLRMVPRGME